MSLANPDKHERAWMDAITRLGCIACRVDGRGHSPAVVHHIIKHGRRVGHLFTIPLCPNHHNSGRRDEDCISRHPWHRAFEKRYGSELLLLDITWQLVDRGK